VINGICVVINGNCAVINNNNNNLIIFQQVNLFQYMN
jgi:hypothetical protein